MRNDGILYTGMTSKAKLAKLEEVKKEKERQKKDKKAKLQPFADVVLEELAKEKKNTILSLLNTIETETPEADIKAKIVAANLYKESISGLEARIKAIMRTK